MDSLIVFIAKFFILLPILATGVVFLRLHGKWRLRFVAVVLGGAILSYLFAKIGSHLYYNARPFVQGDFIPLLSHAPDNGFPSDHTLLAAFLGWACMAFSKKAGIVVLASAALIGAARMAAGVHHLVDVLGSFAFAALGCYVAYFVILKLYPPKRVVATENVA